MNEDKTILSIICDCMCMMERIDIQQTNAITLKCPICEKYEEDNHLVRIEGKIIRDGDCPLKKTISCEDCEFFDGWGFDIAKTLAVIYCTNKNILDGNYLKLDKNKL